MRKIALLLASMALALLLASGVALAAPENDAFDTIWWPGLKSALTEYGTTYGEPVQATNFGATREDGEPAFGFYPDSPYKTVWYKWNADADGRMSIYDLGEGCGEYLDASVGVYTGDALGSLTPVARATQYCRGGVSFDAVKGTTYRIQVGSPFSFEYGTFRFGWSFDRFDNDGDGVLDGPDDCENEFASTASGCPEADLRLLHVGAHFVDEAGSSGKVGGLIFGDLTYDNYGPNTARYTSAYLSFPKGAAVFAGSHRCDTGTDHTGLNTYVSCPVGDLTSNDGQFRDINTYFPLIPTKAGDFTLTHAEVFSDTRDPNNNDNVTNDLPTVAVEPSTDTTRPTGKGMAAAASPSGTGAALGTDLMATFSEKMRPDTINASSLRLFKCPAKDSTLANCTTQITNVAVTLNTDPTSAGYLLKAKLDPFETSTKKLQANTKYKVVATTAAKDAAGNRLDQNPNATGYQPKNWTFTTGSS